MIDSKHGQNFEPGNKNITHELSPDELAQNQSQLVDLADRELNGEEGVLAVWINPGHPQANTIRTLEAKVMPEFPEVMADYEMSSMFLAIVDTRNGVDRVVHGFRVTGAARDESGNVVLGPNLGSEKTGIVLIDDVIASGQGVEVQDFYQYYTSKGLNLNKSMSVESNFRVDDRVEDYNGLPMSNVGYLALFQLVESMGLNEGEAAIFAALNEKARRSLTQTGAEYEPLLGREDLKTPTVNEDGTPGFDEEFQLVAIPASKQNIDTFRSISVFAAPQVTI